MTPVRGTLQIVADAAALAEAGAALLTERVSATSGPVAVCLSGGSTPKALYRRLAEPPFAARLPWNRISFLFGDERFVPPDDPASNFGMVTQSLFSRAPIAADQIHPMAATDLTLDQAASAYEPIVRAHLPFAVTLLGLGDDGHTASLIPGEPVVTERTRLVAAVGHGRPEPRLTLTLPALEQSAQLVFLVSGEGKRAILDRVLRGDDTVPAGMLRPQGKLLFLVDRAAAGSWAE